MSEDDFLKRRRAQREKEGGRIPGDEVKSEGGEKATDPLDQNDVATEIAMVKRGKLADQGLTRLTMEERGELRALWSSFLDFLEEGPALSHQNLSFVDATNTVASYPSEAIFRFILEGPKIWRRKPAFYMALYKEGEARRAFNF